jgi:hypothetical protein
MSMEHKAFVFDYHAFQEQLSIVLREALGAGRVSALPEFIKRNIGALRDPNTGERLGVDWESAVVPKDVHQYADVALTKFYDPSRDRGLGYRWEELQEALARHDLMPSILLGSAFGFARNYFDPGKMGAYFQTPDPPNMCGVLKLSPRPPLATPMKCKTRSSCSNRRSRLKRVFTSPSRPRLHEVSPA